MKKKITPLFAFLILIALIAAFLFGIRKLDIFSYADLSTDENLRMSGVVEDLHRLEEFVNSEKLEYDQKLSVFTDLMSWALRQFVSENRYTGPEVFEDGVVVHIKNGRITYPESFPANFTELDSAEDLLQLTSPAEFTMTGTDGEQEYSEKVVIAAAAIDDDLFYINYTPLEEYEEETDQTIFVSEAFRTLEKSFDGYLFIVNQKDQSSVYSSDVLSKLEDSDELETYRGMLESRLTELKIKNKQYKVIYEDLHLGLQPVKAIVLLRPAESDPYIMTCISIAVVFIFVMAAGLILWIYWIGDYVKNHELTERQQRIYHPAYVRKFAASVALTGAILLFVVLFAYQTLGNLSRASSANSEMVNLLQGRVENRSKSVEYYRKGELEWDVYYGKAIALLYANYPELQTNEFLSNANKLLGTEYIMVFDSQGKELKSSNSYQGFTLGKEVPSTEVFRYLLQGVDQLTIEPEYDPFNDKMLQMVGVRMGLEKEGENGAVILAVSPQNTWETSSQQAITDYVKMLTPQNSLAMIADNGSKTILFSNDSDLTGKKYDEIGIMEDNLVQASLETFEISGVKYYGAFDTKDQYDYFYTTEARSILGNTVYFAVYGALSYLFIYLLISVLLLGISSKKDRDTEVSFKEAIQQYSKSGALKSPQEIDAELDEKIRENGSITEWFKNMPPERKFTQTLNMALTLALTFGVIKMLDNNEFGSQSVLNFILHGSWKRGLNELAILAILCVIAILTYFILLKGLLMRILNSILDAKGETIARLFSSLFQYAAIITAIFFCLSYLGYDTGVLVTSAGFLTLAVSLGSKDLVADILAGIMLIFDGSFHVGDKVEVGGFSGRVIDIGVHSTKLKDKGNNIKVIDNQSVKNYVKKSETASISVNLTVSGTQPLGEIEAMLDRELPKIGEMMPELTSKPVYVGVTAIGYRRVTICIFATCPQKISYETTNRLTREVKRIFDENGYQI